MKSNSVYNTLSYNFILRELLLFKSRCRLFHILRRELDGKYCNEHICTKKLFTILKMVEFLQGPQNVDLNSRAIYHQTGQIHPSKPLHSGRPTLGQVQTVHAGR